MAYREVLQSALALPTPKSTLASQMDSTSSSEQEGLYSDMQRVDESQSCAFFRVYGYKVLITFGLLCDGSVTAQTRTVDRGALDFVLGMT